MPGDSKKSNQVDQYIRQFPPEIQARLVKIRELIRSATPEAEETIAYEMPTYRLSGNLVHFAAFKNHIGLYPTPSGIAAFKEELAEYKGAKGSVQFPHSKPLPYELIRKIVEYRVAESIKTATQKETKRSLKDEAVEKATGKSWGKWFAILNQEKAARLEHKEIVKLLSDKYEVDGWWAQSITVEYERHLGKRKVGQVKDGTFQTAVSKTLPGNLDQVFKIWLSKVRDVKEFNSIPLAGKPVISKSEKWRYWRVELQDGSKVTITVGTKTADKSILTFSTEKLKDQDAIEQWRTYWKDYIYRIISIEKNDQTKKMQTFMALKGQVRIDKEATKRIRNAELNNNDDSY